MNAATAESTSTAPRDTIKRVPAALCSAQGLSGKLAQRKGLSDTLSCVARGTQGRAVAAWGGQLRNAFISLRK